MNLNVQKAYYFWSLLILVITPTLFLLPKVSEMTLGRVLIFSLLSILVCALFDTWSTRHGRRDKFWLWDFNNKYMLGPRIFGVPIEEYLFMIFSGMFFALLWETAGKIVEFGFDKSSYIIIFTMVIWATLLFWLPKLSKPNRTPLDID